MLQLQRDDCVHDPIEAQDWVDTDSSIVPPDLLVSKFFTKEWMLSVWIAKTPVVVDVPETCVHTVDGRKSDESSARRRPLIHTIDAQRSVEHDGCHVLAEIEQMREFVLRVGIAAKTLQSSPDSRKCGQKSDDAQMGRIAGARLVPAARVQAEEGGDVLLNVSKILECQEMGILTPMVYVKEQNISPR